MTIPQILAASADLGTYLDSSADYTSLMSDNSDQFIQIGHIVAAALFGTATFLIRRHTDAGNPPRNLK